MYFAQFGEDRVLAAHLGPGYDKRQGFYVDVGAWGPTLHSVTRHFYDLGYSGVNIEPNPVYHRKLVAARPRDVNLDCGVSFVPGTYTFNVIEDTGLSTFNDDYARHFAVTSNVKRIQVQTRTLADICREHVPPGVEIDFLKIDVEGWEQSVLKSADWQAYRPRLVVVEATIPMTEIPVWDRWEPLLTEADYEHVASDRVNRFYRRRE